jgi:hypothetical protein
MSGAHGKAPTVQQDIQFSGRPLRLGRIVLCSTPLDAITLGTLTIVPNM